MIARTMPRSDVSKLESHLFRMYDTNRDDHIDFVEFMNIFSMLAGGDPKEILNNLFRVFDVDGDQQITVVEMDTLVQDLQRWRVYYCHARHFIISGFHSVCKHFHSCSLIELQSEGKEIIISNVFK